MRDQTEDKASGRRDFDEREIAEIEAHATVRPPVIFESIRRQGLEEMRRPTSALALSGVAAGFAIGFSVLGEALLRVHLPDTPWRPLIENLGYAAGFLIVILGQMQLFTENTITPVCSVLEDPSARMFQSLARIWGVVLGANLAGAAVFAASASHGGALDADVLAAMVDISAHAAGYGFWETVIRGVPAGWLIAALVWISPSITSKFTIIVFLTYLIALGDFAHVVAGSMEAALLVLVGEASLIGAYGGFVAPALIGNVLGGSALFTLLVWGQIRSELPRRNEG